MLNNKSKPTLKEIRAKLLDRPTISQLCDNIDILKRSITIDFGKRIPDKKECKRAIEKQEAFKRVLWLFGHKKLKIKPFVKADDLREGFVSPHMVIEDNPLVLAATTGRRLTINDFKHHDDVFVFLMNLLKFDTKGLDKKDYMMAFLSQITYGTGPTDKDAKTENKKIIARPSTHTSDIYGEKTSKLEGAINGLLQKFDLRTRDTDVEFFSSVGDSIIPELPILKKLDFGMDIIIDAIWDGEIRLSDGGSGSVLVTIIRIQKGKEIYYEVQLSAESIGAFFHGKGALGQSHSWWGGKNKFTPYGSSVGKKEDTASIPLACGVLPALEDGLRLSYEDFKDVFIAEDVATHVNAEWIDKKNEKILRLKEKFKDTSNEEIKKLEKDEKFQRFVCTSRAKIKNKLCTALQDLIALNEKKQHEIVQLEKEQKKLPEFIEFKKKCLIDMIKLEKISKQNKKCDLSEVLNTQLKQIEMLEKMAGNKITKEQLTIIDSKKQFLNEMLKLIAINEKNEQKLDLSKLFTKSLAQLENFGDKLSEDKFLTKKIELLKTFCYEISQIKITNPNFEELVITIFNNYTTDTKQENSPAKIFNKTRDLLSKANKKITYFFDNLNIPSEEHKLIPVTETFIKLIEIKKDIFEDIKNFKETLNKEFLEYLVGDSQSKKQLSNK